jgi:hypothetical protein
MLLDVPGTPVMCASILVMLVSFKLAPTLASQMVHLLVAHAQVLTVALQFLA